MEAFFGSNPIVNGRLVEKSVSKQPLSVNWQGDPNKLYTLIVYDISTTPTFIHYLASDIHGSDIRSGRVIIPYKAPSPPKGTTHQYYIDLFEQKDPIQTNSISDLSHFILKNKLTTIKQIGFLVDPPTEKQVKFCHCVLEVQQKGSAYNPYAVCAHSVGTTYRHCSDEVYDFNTMTIPELQAYVALHKLPLSDNRNQLLQSITQYKLNEGKPI